MTALIKPANSNMASSGRPEHMPVPSCRYSNTNTTVLQYRRGGTGVPILRYKFRYWDYRPSPAFGIALSLTPPQKKNKEGNDIHRFPLHILKLYSNLLQRYNYATVVRDGRKFLNATLANNFNLVSADAHLNQFVSNSLRTLLRQSLVV